ncbi:MAG: hypothetical protein DBY09_05265 [Selenomonadales bacterium]|nr:MAG: hypothetical protein DBY09_05265 [Selenomonadales bacterium]
MHRLGHGGGGRPRPSPSPVTQRRAARQGGGVRRPVPAAGRAVRPGPGRLFKKSLPLTPPPGPSLRQAGGWGARRPVFFYFFIKKRLQLYIK